MQYLSFAFTAIALVSIANSTPILFEAATTKQALGVDPIPAKFGSDNSYNPPAINKAAVNPYQPNTAKTATNIYQPTNNKAAYENNDIDTAYSVYRSDLQTLAKEISGRASTQRVVAANDYARAAYKIAQTSFESFRTAARPTATVCASLKLIPAQDQETAVKYVAFIQHTADEAYEQSIEGDGESAYWSFCLIDDYMAAVSGYVESVGVYNGRSIGTY